MGYKDLSGKTIKSIERQMRGHYGYAVYVIVFTDGTEVLFEGDAHANCDCTITPAKKPKE